MNKSTTIKHLLIALIVLVPFTSIWAQENFRDDPISGETPPTTNENTESGSGLEGTVDLFDTKSDYLLLKNGIIIHRLYLSQEELEQAIQEGAQIIQLSSNISPYELPRGRATRENP